MQLKGDGVTLALRNITMYHWRSAYMRSSPGVDLLADSPPTPAGETAPSVLLQYSNTVYAVCLSLQLEAASLFSLERPAAYPGNHSYISIPQPPKGPSCTNSTAVAVRERCYASRAMLLDVAITTRTTDAFGTSRTSNYDMRALDVWMVCVTRWPDDCVSLYGFDRCYAMYPVRLPPPEALSAASSSGGGVELEVLLPAVLGGACACVGCVLGGGGGVRACVWSHVGVGAGVGVCVCLFEKFVCVCACAHANGGGVPQASPSFSSLCSPHEIASIAGCEQSQAACEPLG